MSQEIPQVCSMIVSDTRLYEVTMEGIKKLGELFRLRREEMSLSLKEVENATSIRTMYLQAIEDGKVQKILSTVYALGFIRQYASFLGFNQEMLMKDYPDAMKMQVEQQEFSYGIGTMEARGSPTNGIRSLPNLAWAVGVIIVLAVAWYFGKLIGAF